MLKEYLEKKLRYVDEEIKKELNLIKFPKTISEGMAYSVLNGGKRLRPILLLASLEAMGINFELGIKSAIAIELIHSYSLVHDDLPALDNDTYRRGKLTTHKKFGEAEAILIGDALLTHAFYILSEKNKKILKDRQIVDIVSEVAFNSGVNGMVSGQMIDIESENKEIDVATLEYIHKNKTGKLINLPVKIACIIAEIDRKTEQHFLEYANLIGLAFQIKDDILDVESSFEELGKTVGKDIYENKSTYVSKFGVEKSKEILKESVQNAINILENELKNFDTRILKELALYIVDRKK